MRLETQVTKKEITSPSPLCHIYKYLTTDNKSQITEKQ